MTPRAGNRERLLNAAIHCIEERGYARTTARDLVAASNTNLGAITYHFESKEALLNEALAECCRRWLEQVRQAATSATSGNPWEDAVTVAQRALQAGRTVAVAYVEAWAQAERAPELRSQLAEHYREFRANTAALVESLPTHPDETAPDAEVLAAILVAVVDGLMIQFLLDPDSLPDAGRFANALSRLTGAAPSRDQSSAGTDTP
jgi:AcrR family transcriptional regulator